MALARDDVTTGMLAQLEAFEAQVRALDPSQLALPTRCAGWSVDDVAAHVIGTQADITAGRFDGLGTPEVTARQVAERRGRGADELADELRDARKIAADLLAAFDAAAWAGPAPAGIPGTLGDGVEALWYDTFVHGDDIRDALGQSSVRDDGLRASLSHISVVLAGRGWGPAVLALDGMPTFPIGDGGRVITGDPLAFVLVATGRRPPELFGLDASVNLYA
jgi:uncharacterized protein (TIGR03083 family)